MTSYQILIAVSLVIAVILWVTKKVDRTIVSLGLIFAFTIACLIGRLPVRPVYSFLMSENFVLIVLSFIFSEGIKNSGLLSKILLPILSKANSPTKLLISMFIVTGVLIFVIPQPFSRIILVSLIYGELFDKMGMEKSMKGAWMFILYACSIYINMGMIRGDFILNNAMISASGLPITEAIWTKNMLVPSVVLTIISLVVFKIVFAERVKEYPQMPQFERANYSKSDKINLVFLLIVILLWATESLHKISGTYIVLAGCLLMFFPFKLLEPKDIKCVDVKLLVFLTACFSIGGVMKSSGTAEIIFSELTRFFPKEYSLIYLLIIVLVTMVMHFALGSSVTTMSVVIPSMMIIGQNVVPTYAMLFAIYIIAAGHIIFPFHNVITMIGEGRGDFDSKDQTKFSIVMTVPIILIVLIIFNGWWSIIGTV